MMNGRPNSSKASDMAPVLCALSLDLANRALYVLNEAAEPHGECEEVAHIFSFQQFQRVLHLDVYHAGVMLGRQASRACKFWRALSQPI